MKKLIYHTKNFLLIPDGPEEITGRQFIYIAGLLHSGDTRLLISIKALRVLARKTILQWLFIPAEIKLKCLSHIQWIFENFFVTKQLVPSYRGYFGPKSNLDNMVLSEFHFAEQYYAEIKKDDYTSLNHLIAVLYRLPKKKYNFKLDIDGDAREEFNSNIVDFHARKIKRWPMAVKFAILMYYDGCRSKLADDNSKIFSGESSGTGLGMYTIMRGIAGPKFGDLEKVEKMYLHTALLELNLMMEEEERLETLYKQTG